MAERLYQTGSTFSRSELVFLSAWLAAMILNPLAAWTSGQSGLLAMTNAMVLAQTGLGLILLSRHWPLRRLLRLLAIILPGAWLAEWIGISTGLPFGLYHYTNLLQPQLAGVPVLIPVAWLMMLPCAWAVAAGLVSPRRRWLFAAVSGLAFTAWDFYLDPQMVANQLWTWTQPGEYFGIPLLNMAGWWLVSSLITRVVAPDELPLRPLALIYTLTCLMELIGLGLFWGQPLPALAGFVLMGGFALHFWSHPARDLAVSSEV
jgi:lycopene beta-cyclase